MKRITLPLAVSLLLLLLYGAAELFKPDLIGPELSRYVIAALLVGLSIAAVRAAGFVLFDLIFQKRKAGLEEYAHMIPEEEHRAQTHAILRRIRHFFGLI